MPSVRVPTHSHIDVMLSAARYMQHKVYYHRNVSYPLLTTDDLTAAGNKLMNTVVAAYNQRYNLNYKPASYTYHGATPTPVECLKAIEYYEYQAGGRTFYENTFAYSIVCALRQAAIAALPGYQDAPWGF